MLTPLFLYSSIILPTSECNSFIAPQISRCFVARSLSLFSFSSKICFEYLDEDADYDKRIELQRKKTKLNQATNLLKCLSSL